MPRAALIAFFLHPACFARPNHRGRLFGIRAKLAIASRSEPGVQVQVCSRALLGIEAACDVEPDQAIEGGRTDACTAHGPADSAPELPIAGPADVSEQHRPKPLHRRSDLDTPQPVCITRLGRVRPLSANRVCATEVPVP